MSGKDLETLFLLVVCLNSFVFMELVCNCCGWLMTLLFFGVSLMTGDSSLSSHNQKKSLMDE